MTKTVELTDEAVGHIVNSLGLRLDAYPEYDGGWEYWANIRYEAPKALDFAGMGTVELIDSYIAGEGYRDYGHNPDSYMVFRVLWNDGTETFYRKQGHYESYEYKSQWTGDFASVEAKVETKVVYL